MSIKAETSFSLKDNLFNRETVAVLTEHLTRADRHFDADGFAESVLAQFPDLELKERISCMVDALEERFPEDFEEAVQRLHNALPKPLDPTLSDNDFGHFIWAVPGEYVARHGCTAQRLDTALVFLRESTKRFSSEGPIRPFLKNFPDRTLPFMHDCAVDSNYHVRRWASEGTRPYLPWCSRADVAPAEIIPILDKLHADTTRYVTRSVANNLNDITKIEPDLVIDTLKRWQALGEQEADELDWMTRHSLRTLLKNDYPGALAMQGYTDAPEITIDEVQASAVVGLGEDFRFTCRLESGKEQKLKVNLKIHFLKANGKHAPKVFAVKDKAFSAGERLELTKKQTFRPMTTRTLYPGTHHVELVVNGVTLQEHSFEFTGEAP